MGSHCNALALSTLTRTRAVHRCHSWPRESSNKTRQNKTKTKRDKTKQFKFKFWQFWLRPHVPWSMVIVIDDDELPLQPRQHAAEALALRASGGGGGEYQVPVQNCDDSRPPLQLQTQTEESKRGRGRIATYGLARLLESLLLSRLLSNVESLPEVLVRAVSFVLGPAEGMNLDISCPVCLF